MRGPFPVFLMLALLFLSSCGNEEIGWSEVPEAKLSSVQRQQRARAIETRDALATGLMKRLMDAMDEHGVAGAITTCQAEAPALAREVTQKTGVEIGRTSLYRRNPANIPPDWAQDYVAKEVPDAVYLADQEGRLAALLPIRLMQTCLRCHGSEAAIGEEILMRIRRYYPEDEAIGFAVGDIRGYFWLVVPAP